MSCDETVDRDASTYHDINLYKLFVDPATRLIGHRSDLASMDIEKTVEIVCLKDQDPRRSGDMQEQPAVYNMLPCAIDRSEWLSSSEIAARFYHPPWLFPPRSIGRLHITVSKALHLVGSRVYR